jgi:hypothetical protein
MDLRERRNSNTTLVIILNSKFHMLFSLEYATNEVSIALVVPGPILML